MAGDAVTVVDDGDGDGDAMRRVSSEQVGATTAPRKRMVPSAARASPADTAIARLPAQSKAEAGAMKREMLPMLDLLRTALRCWRQARRLSAGWSNLDAGQALGG